jgi:hypothetical protein
MVNIVFRPDIGRSGSVAPVLDQLSRTFARSLPVVAVRENQQKAARKKKAKH